MYKIIRQESNETYFSIIFYKVIIAMETGIIPPNLHFKKPRRGITALENGNFRVVVEPTPWKPGLVGINSFGFGGSNAHVLLRPNPKEKVNNAKPTDNLPRLVVMSGCTKEAVESFLTEVYNNKYSSICYYKINLIY